MATSRSVTFRADSDKVWGAVIKLITSAGYAVAETNQAAKQIVYQASGGGWAWKQNVQVSVTTVDEGEVMVTVLAEAAGQASLTEGGQQRKLINFVIDELRKKFPLAENQPKSSGAPGTSGCYVVTATYGLTSRQAILVHARCRQRFLLNPFLTVGWCIYKYYGPVLAQWSHSSAIGYRVCKSLLADPIVGAARKGFATSAFCMLYLTLLSLLGVVLLVPSILVRLVIRPFSAAVPSQLLEKTNTAPLRRGSLRQSGRPGS